MLKVLRGFARAPSFTSGLRKSEVVDAETTREKATLAQSKGNWIDARDLWLEVVRCEPDDKDAWIQLGNMLNEMADHPTALKAFDEATRLDPDSFSAIAGQAGVHERVGDWRLAQHTWLNAAQLASDVRQTAHAYSHAVLSAHMIGDDTNLSHVTMNATAAAPGFLDGAEHLPLRARLLRQNQPSAAKLLLRQHLQNVPDDAASRFDFASICLEDGDYTAGLTVLAPSLAQDDVPPSFLWLAADLHERLRQWKSVLEICDQVVAAGTTELRFVRRGFHAALRLGDFPTARRHVARFTSMSGGELILIDELRAAYESVGDLRRASLLCRWVSKRWPHSHWHMGNSIKLVAATSGLIDADRLTQRTIAEHGRNAEVDAAYCYSAFLANEPAEAQRRFTWYLAGPGRGNLDSEITLGYVLANSVGLHEAEQQFLSIAASNFQTKKALVGLAHMASRRRDLRATMECWGRVSAMYPDDTIAQVEHARSVYNYGDHKDARRLCEKALNTLPSNTTMGEFYIWLLVAMGKDLAAQAYLLGFEKFSGPSWDALEAAVLSAGRLGTLEREWRSFIHFLPSASHASASSRLYQITRILMYFNQSKLAGEVIDRTNIEERYTAWLSPYVRSGELTVAPRLQHSAKQRWNQVAAQVSDAPARRLRSMSSANIQSILDKPAHELPTIHIVNKFEQPRGGSELHALDLAVRLAQHAKVELWAPEMPHPSFSAGQRVQAIDQSQGRAPHGGTLVLVGIYFPINWIALARPARIVFLYNTFEAPALYERVQEAASLTGVAVELLFCSDLIGAECGLPGLFEPSPIDIDIFCAAPTSPLEATRAKPFSLGRHSRDVMEKHHLDDAAVYQAVATGGGQSVVLGGTCMRSAFSTVPALDLLPARTSGIVEFLRGLDTYFYRTSTWVEPWGRVVVEAMACEVPVLVHETGGYAQIIKHDENGLLFQTTNEAVEQVRRLQNDPVLRQRLAKAGRATVEELLGNKNLARLTVFYMLEP